MASERLQDTDTVYYRFNLWGAALRLALAHPLLGVGFFNFGTAMTGIEQGFGSLLPGLPDVEGGGAMGVATHNTFLTLLVEFGAVGFVLYAVVFVTIVQRAKTNMYLLWGRPGRAWVFGFTILYLINAQFASAFEAATSYLFFGFLGAMAGARKEMV
jgi:O-antigen ligase